MIGFRWRRSHKWLVGLTLRNYLDRDRDVYADEGILSILPSHLLSLVNKGNAAAFANTGGDGSYATKSNELID
jgi:hypothetical protein